MSSRALLTRYWFTFYSNDINDLPMGIRLGCGLTAYDHNDAITILRQKVFKGEQIPEFKSEIENIYVDVLDQAHVIHNMKDPTLRGVWFPQGYE
ncbi:MAG TPA: hypothetical protein VK666_04285 [Chryseolinea sp.]|nr:hypothetical protein [Chryseolinea sp.]